MHQSVLIDLGTLCKTPELFYFVLQILALLSSLVSDLHSCNLGILLGPVWVPLPCTVTGNFLHAVSWYNSRSHFGCFFFFSPEFTVLFCLIHNVLKQLYHIFFSVFLFSLLLHQGQKQKSLKGILFKAERSKLEFSICRGQSIYLFTSGF